MNEYSVLYSAYDVTSGKRVWQSISVAATCKGDAEDWAIRVLNRACRAAGIHRFPVVYHADVSGSFESILGQEVFMDEVTLDKETPSWER